MNKKELRQHYKELILASSKEELDHSSKRANDFLIKEISFKSLIGSFSPLPHEINISPYNSLLSEKSLLALPRIENKQLDFHLVENLDRDLICSKKGILEPNPTSCQKLNPNQIFYFLVPGLAFDKNGFRLGFGGGFYDRFISAYPSIKTIGIGYHFQLSANPLPREEHDQRLKKILTF